MLKYRRSRSYRNYYWPVKTGTSCTSLVLNEDYENDDDHCCKHDGNHRISSIHCTLHFKCKYLSINHDGVDDDGNTDELGIVSTCNERKVILFSSFICLDSQAHCTIFHSHWFNCPELLKYWDQGNIYWVVCSVALRWNTCCNFRPLVFTSPFSLQNMLFCFLYGMHSKNIGGLITTLGEGLNYSGERGCLGATINVQFLAMTQGLVCWFSTFPCEVFSPDSKLTFDFYVNWFAWHNIGVYCCNCVL